MKNQSGILNEWNQVYAVNHNTYLLYFIQYSRASE